MSLWSKWTYTAQIQSDLNTQKNKYTYHQITYNASRFEVLTVVLEKMQFFWDVTLCQLVKHYSISKKPAASTVRVQEQD
jgi:hypothetical protein